MDFALVGILLASSAALAVLVYLMCRDAMSASWLEFSTQSRQQMRREEKGKTGAKQGLWSFADKLFATKEKGGGAAGFAAQKKMADAKKGKGGIFGNVYVRILIASFAAYMLFFGYFFITAKPPAFEASIMEGPLVKNVQLSLLEGKYVYAADMKGNKANITYGVSSTPSCVGYVVLGDDGTSTLCIGKDGRVAGEASQSNLSATQAGAFYLFAPWMLAVKEGWRWDVYVGVVEKNVGVNYSTKFEYSCTAKESLFGRDAYKVEIKSNGQPIGTSFIDVQKRVLLLQNSTLGEIALIDAPFLGK